MPAAPDLKFVHNERIFALWDRMTAQDTADAGHALRVLLLALCDLLAAKTAVCMVAARLPDLDGDDPVHGWRPCHISYLHPDAGALENARLAMHSDSYGQPDITVINNVDGAGIWRARRLVELAPPEWFESPYYEQFYTRLGRIDAIWVACPINQDLEIYIGIYRGEGQAPFEPPEAETALFAMRGLRWFLQRYLLDLGLDAASAPLTDTERAVLHGLLKGQAQKAVATELAQSVHTTREHIQTIYRKFNVNSRAELMALWLA